MHKNKRTRPHRSDMGLNRISWKDSRATVRQERVTQTVESHFYAKILDAEKDSHLTYKKNDNAGDNSGDSRTCYTR